MNHPAARRRARPLATALMILVGLAPAARAGAEATQIYVAQAPAAERPRPLTGARATAGAAHVTPQDGEVDLDQRKSRGVFSFEFSKAEIIDVVRAISDMTRQNFIVPEKIKGQRITILSPTKVTAAEAYHVFFTALATNGISLVKTGRFYKLADAKEAIKDAVPTCVDDDPRCRMGHEQMVTLILHLHHTDAAQINAVVRTLISKDGDVTIFAPSNALIVSEYAPNLRRLRKIVESLDVPGGDDDLQLMQVHNSLASELAEKITQVFDVQARERPGPGSRPIGAGSQPAGANEANEVSISKIVADDRTNQLIIKANRRSFHAVKNLIARLDVPMTEAEQGKVHVYYLENAKSEDLASTLSSLSQGAPAGGKGSRGAPPSGLPGAIGGGRGGGAGGDSASLFEGEVKITADKATNSLLVLSSAHDFRAIRTIIEKLDRPRRQVYVEAAIMEVTLDDNEQAGLHWHTPIPGLGSDPATAPVAFLQSAETSGISPTFSALYNIAGLQAAAAGALGGLFSQGVLPVTAGDGSPLQIPKFGVLLKWLQTSSNLNLLSTPHLMTTDNEQAHIEVGQKVPFNTGFFGGASSLLGSLGGQGGSAAGGLGALGALGGLGSLGGIGSVQRIDVSLKLTLTPQINEGDKVRLEIDQTVEDLSSSDPKAQQPATSHRQLKTVVVVDDQQTIVLGGLMRDKTSESESKIPYISEIPILGYLFKQRTVNVNKINLLLVLTPHIISGPADMQRIFERKMTEDQEFRDEFYGGSPAYRAHINYARKVGVLGRMVGIVRRERQRWENGGDTDPADIMIKPRGAKPAAPADRADGPVENDDAPAADAADPADAAQQQPAEAPVGTGETGLRGMHLSPGASFPRAPRAGVGERAREHFDLQPVGAP